MGQGWPTVTTLGAVPKRGGSFAQRNPDAGCAFSLVTFSFAQASVAQRSNSRRMARRASKASQEKVTRRKGETGSNQLRNTQLEYSF